MATLKDIAQKTNTSITTVSRVLNYDKTLSVSEKVRQNILQAAQDLNYTPRRKRTSSDTTSSYHIGIVMWYDAKEEQDDPYYMQIRRGIEQSANAKQIRTTLVYKKQDRFDLQILSGIDALICVGKFSDAQIHQFRKLTTHLVFVDSSPDEDQFDSIVIDFHKAVKEVLSTLLEKGYKTIGYLGGVEFISKQIKLGERRELVFRDFLFQRNKLYTKYIHVGDFSIESGYQLMQEALSKKDHAEVYFCANDSIAFGALRAIHEHGLSVPGDIGIVGFNNNPNTAFTFPPLTTVDVPTEFMGEEALKSAVELLQGRSIAMKKVVPTNIVKRSSI
jgi:LacI family transcriptional regulator